MVVVVVVVVVDTPKLVSDTYKILIRAVLDNSGSFICCTLL